LFFQKSAKNNVDLYINVIFHFVKSVPCFLCNFCNVKIKFFTQVASTFLWWSWC